MGDIDSEFAAIAEFTAESADDANPSASDKTTESRAVDIAHRQLCPDGACNGILGSDGRCKVCGLIGNSVTSDPRLRGLQRADKHAGEIDEASVSDEEEAFAEDEDEDEDENESVEPDNMEKANSGADSELPSHFSKRYLCPDGSCIGVVAANGRCPECGNVA